MKIGKKKFTYLLGGMIIIALLIVLAYIKSPIYKEKKQEEAIKNTELYLAENYQDLNYVNTVRENLEIIRSGDQYRKLFTMTELFHSTMDIDVILENVIVTIEENFTNF